MGTERVGTERVGTVGMGTEGMGTERVGTDNWKLMIMGVTRRMGLGKGRSVGWVVRGGVGWLGTVWDGREIA